MMFKERWAYVAVIFITACVVYMMPLGYFLEPHKKCECPKAPHYKFPKEMIIHGNSKLNSTSLDSILRRNSNQKANGHFSPTILSEKNGWILDCVTWEPKWETPTLDADPHEFYIDDTSNNVQHEDDMHRQNTFIEIFKKKDWPANDPSYEGLQASGPGSMLKNAQGVIATLHIVITMIKHQLKKSVITVLDLPCGDLQWMKKFLVTRNDVQYYGADIVPHIIEHHQKIHVNLPRTQFFQHDIVKSPLNQSYDLIISRDMLQHLWKDDAMKALLHFSQSKSSYFLATNFPDTSHNGDVEKDALGGRKYSYNLELPPFSLVPPICSSYDWNIEHLALWDLPLRQKLDI